MNSAEEVIQSVKHSNGDHIFMRPNHVNLSTVRAKYRSEKRKARYKRKITFIH